MTAPKKTRLELENEQAAYTEGRNAAIDRENIVFKHEALVAWRAEGLVEHFIRGYAEVRFKSPEEDDDE